MILVVDNNEERRKNTVSWLRVKGYMSSSTNFSELSFYTKPFLTVYVNPTSSEASSITDAEDTLSLFICDRPSVKIPPFAHSISKLKTPYISIMKFFDEKFDHLGADQMEIVGYACHKNNEFALGGERIDLSSLEHLIVCFFMINYNKRFKLYDAASYFNFKSNPENNFRKAISRINSKCKRELRLPLIIANEIEAYFNPEISSYICQPYVEETLETDTMNEVIFISSNNEF